MLGNELGSWNGTAFVAPVDGVYIFRLNIVTYYNSRSYRWRALINGGEDGVDQLMENTNRYQTSNSYGHSHSFQIERELKVGDILTIVDQQSYGTIPDYSYYKCTTNQEEHSCSYITGRLIKRL